MSNLVIEVDNLSKKYNIVHSNLLGFNTLRDKINGAVTHPIKLLTSLKNNKREEFWALRDINFSTEAGEIIGVIGGNGAGKSTLLKLLSRITPPSRGQVKIVGRVASLLEVGTGFHPELTGRENIFLNGAILGMPKSEIVKKFDDIVEFAGVAKFLDTPVKRYSSGMYVRLAFAVAAHMDSDILFVDEVLAIGDAEFQQKCLGKMGEMIKDKKKTILFVSHNLSTIKSLCHRSILLANGRIVADGPTAEVIEKYLQTKDEQVFGEQTYHEDKNQLVNLKQVRLMNEAGQTANTFDCDHKIVVNFSCLVDKPVPGLYGCLTVKTNDGTIILESFSHDSEPNPFNNLKPSLNDFSLAIPARSLAPGHYSVYLSFSAVEAAHDISDDILVGTLELTDKATRKSDARNGWFSTIIDWKNK
jgi:lipopolysaccharide transport system ATP-binding protein